ncbi:MAG TPA: hypothetical protein VGI87_03500 [Solirubrobacteraceae bacterium]
MSDALQAQAEILKLARLLHRDPDELSYLGEIPSADIRRLRDQITDVLFDAQSHALGRVAAASKLLPVGVAATIGQRAFGPVLSARITGLLDPGRAVEIADRMPIPFLADVAIELDPRRAREVIARIPAQRIAQITGELVRRGEYVAMGRFVGHLPDGTLLAVVSAMDDASLLRVAFVLEAKGGLDDLIAMLPPERLDSVIDAASREQLWVEALDLLANLAPEHRAELAERAGEHGDNVLEQIVRTATERGLWVELLPLLDSLSPDAVEIVAREAARLDPTQREAIAANARAAGLGDQIALLERAAQQA